VSVRLVTEQVNVPLLLAERAGLPGTAMSWLMTTALLTAVQPLAPVVTTEYVPGALTINVLALLPPVQTSPVPELVALSVRLVTAQVNVPLVGKTLTVGTAVSLLTVVVVTLEQPVAVFVTVTEYTPAAITIRVLPLPANVPDGPLKA
jgi:hypothetical protein